MTDIVERLRQATEPIWTHTRDEVIKEAADEIERLRHELDKATRLLGQMLQWQREFELEKLKSERR